MEAMGRRWTGFRSSWPQAVGVRVPPPASSKMPANAHGSGRLGPAAVPRGQGVRVDGHGGHPRHGRRSVLRRIHELRHVVAVDTDGDFIPDEFTVSITID